MPQPNASLAVVMCDQQSLSRLKVHGYDIGHVSLQPRSVRLDHDPFDADPATFFGDIKGHQVDLRDRVNLRLSQRPNGDPKLRRAGLDLKGYVGPLVIGVV